METLLLQQNRLVRELFQKNTTWVSARRQFEMKCQIWKKWVFLLIRIPQSIPTGTTGTLPVTLTLNGNTRQLTFFGGENVTVEDVTGTGVLMVLNDKYNGILQLLSTPTPATA